MFVGAFARELAEGADQYRATASGPNSEVGERPPLAVCKRAQTVQCNLRSSYVGAECLHSVLNTSNKHARRRLASLGLDPSMFENALARVRTSNEVLRTACPAVRDRPNSRHGATPPIAVVQQRVTPFPDIREQLEWYMAVNVLFK